MLRFVTTADTEILATAAAVRRLPQEFPAVRCANPQGTRDLDPFLDHVLDDARVVVVRILGGRRGWPGGVERLAERCRADEIPLIALGGESRPDAEMTALSTAPAGAVAQVGETGAPATSTTSSRCSGSSPTRSCSRGSGSTHRRASPTSGSISPDVAT